MNIKMFYHSLISDWNHGNAHFLRGIVTELLYRGHDVHVYEPSDAWSMKMLQKDQGNSLNSEFQKTYPNLKSTGYQVEDLNLDALLSDADLVIVHEWNEPELVNQIGRHRSHNDHYRLLFHDTHHRIQSLPEQIEKFKLCLYDGVLAFGEIIRQIYLERNLAQNVWTWHEAADTRVFKPIDNDKDTDVIWIGNWGDDERAAEIKEFLIGPVRDLKLSGSVYGVRYPDNALKEFEKAGIKYHGWAPNYYVPQLFSKAKLTVHIPRNYYTRYLPGIPTIRPFEALACGIPLICSPWRDSENLFREGKDYLLARNSREMKENIRNVINDNDLAESLARNGLETILKRHTCGCRVDELLDICRELEISENKLYLETQLI